MLSWKQQKQQQSCQPRSKLNHHQHWPNSTPTDEPLSAPSHPARQQIGQQGLANNDEQKEEETTDAADAYAVVQEVSLVVPTTKVTVIHEEAQVIATLDNKKEARKARLLLLVLLLIGAALAVSLALGLSNNMKSSPSAMMEPTTSPTLLLDEQGRKNFTKEEQIFKLLQLYNGNSETTLDWLNDEGSPKFQALKWLVYEDLDENNETIVEHCSKLDDVEFCWPFSTF